MKKIEEAGWRPLYVVLLVIENYANQHVMLNDIKQKK
jgi:hypothetical protein